MASAAIQWAPAPGRHKVAIGSSLARALKARKGPAPPKRSNLPDRDFYSFRYNFTPESIDPDRPGTVEVKRGKESTSISLERPSTQGENYVFKGIEHPVKDYDCVLIYDEELGTFTLEKVDGFMTFSYDRKVQGSGPSTQNVTSPQTSTPQTRDDSDLDKKLEELLGTEDAEGEPDDEYEEVINTRNMRKEEEEEEEDLLETLLKPSPPVRPPDPPPKQKASRAPLKKQESIPKPKTISKDAAKPKKEPESRVMLDSVLVEELDPGVLPARPLKRHKPTPPEGLALPSASASVDLPSSRPPPPAQDADDSDLDDYWESVLVEPEPGTDLDNDAEEIDPDEFGREMEAQLGGTGDEGSPEPDTKRQPMSLNDFARSQFGGQYSDDSSSSSEESDDE
ncbi:RNA polymerase II transcription elongation factor-domain-containing protein [Pisolithus orientalis]|uniref:RNA polymerase II transcription elongation factor-domain-containing protein n=1 Tax=Pisolithus orientalis TaxID=936130 RepID=UPI0022251A43|nr:RNA polymerase II transcription elongation factor-domain-containing protein [Pisolithus orientalis]KAI6035573.1 RNA polymerase II transcription elongation factor-domain-containing protein [Pisolithus orientalis]